MCTALIRLNNSNTTFDPERWKVNVINMIIDDNQHSHGPR